MTEELFIASLVWAAITVVKCSLIIVIAIRSKVIVQNIVFVQPDYDSESNSVSFVDDYVEVILGYLTKISIFNKREVINAVLRSRREHIIMLGLMRTDPSQFAKPQDLEELETNDVILETEIFEKAKTKYYENLVKSKIKIESKNKKINKGAVKDIAKVVMYVFICIMIAGI